MDELEIKLLPQSENAVAKKFHGNMPQRTRTGYGIPFDGSFATLPNIIDRTRSVKTGRINAHPIPTIVCL
jgi:hypothetical protein